MDLYTIAVKYLGIPTVSILVGGMVYKFIRYVAFARVHTPKPEFRWREHVLKHAGIFNIGFWYWIKGILEAILRPIIWSVRVNYVDFVGGLALLHLIGVIPILLLAATHTSIWLSYIPYIVLGPISTIGLFNALNNLLNMIYIPLSYGGNILTLTGWGILSILANIDVLALLAIAATMYKLVDHVYKACRGIINIRPGDIVALILLLGVLISGYVAVHLPADVDPLVMREILGLHILLGELLFMTLPFTKFSHFLYGYWYGKLHEVYDAYAKRGV